MQLSPNAPWVLCNLGLAYASLEQWGKAVDMFRQSLALDPSYAGAVYHLDMALKAERQHDQAVKIVERVEETSPTLPVAINLASESGKK